MTIAQVGAVAFGAFAVFFGALLLVDIAQPEPQHFGGRYVAARALVVLGFVLGFSFWLSSLSAATL